MSNDFDELPELPPKPITRNSIWRTQAGKLVTVKDMDDQHVLNLIRCFRNMSPVGTRILGPPAKRREWVNVLANEAYARGLQLDPLAEGEPVHE